MTIRNYVKDENCAVTFEAYVPADVFAESLDDMAKDYSEHNDVDGFERGEATREAVCAKIGEYALHDAAIKSIAPKAFDLAVSEYGIRFISAPNVTDVDFNDDGSITIFFSVSVFPEAKLGAYKGLTAPMHVGEVTEEMIDDEVNKARQHFAHPHTADRPAQLGDIANIDFEGFKDGVAFDGGKGEHYDLELGSGSFIPGFEEQIVGMSAGDEKDINVTFPENYGAAELAGKPVVFHIVLNEVKKMHIPEADDELAKMASGFDTMEKYREILRSTLEETARQNALNDFRTEILKKAIDNLECDVPEAMIDDKVDEILGSYRSQLLSHGYTLEQYMQMAGVTEETIRSSLRPDAKNSILSEVLLALIIEAENITVTDEEIEAQFSAVAEANHVTVDDVKAQVSERTVRADMKKSKACGVMFESATVE